MQKFIPIPPTQHILANPLEYLKGVGPQRAELLKKELGLHNFKDLLEFFPFRHIDKTKVEKIASLLPGADYVQVAGRLTSLETIGERSARRLVGRLKDDTGELELVWFQGIAGMQKFLQPGMQYLVFAKPAFFMSRPQMVHPELELYAPEKLEGKKHLEPIYSSTEKLKTRGLNGRAIGKLTEALFAQLSSVVFPENLPANLVAQYRFASRWDSLRQVHFPASTEAYQQAVRRLKFEELFFAQLRLGMLRSNRHRYSKGWVFDKVGTHFNSFYEEYLPFQLTGAQKRVLKEIRKDMQLGRQMNRLLQGDVGSGKTIVALLSMLIACDNGFQSVLMAPTEILARQHFESVSSLLGKMPLQVMLLTGSTPARLRKQVLAAAASGELHILIGTHAVIEDKVTFKNLGFAVIDEQHKFGVAQRARLWSKNTTPPHVLVMTATPIPRTLALTAYGDLDYSVIDELPPGRQPIRTFHRFEHKRPQVMDFIREQLELGRQAYIVYPLIEESAAMDYENLMKGFEEVKSFFPEPKFWISMVHGRQPADQKETNMARFVSGDTQIMVSTTVIEVGVNVPNASIMVIESAEKFGLSQLHQLRGRVGRGAEQSYCILLTGNRVSRDARERLEILCATNDGFKVAEKDLEIRGPGDIEGTRQSGMLSFKLADLVQDRAILEVAKEVSTTILEIDPDLNLPEHEVLKSHLRVQAGKTAWSKIS